jgi:chitinase
VPALAKLCAKGVAKGGKSVFKFKGKDYEVKVDKPLTTKRDREPSASPTRPPENTNKPSSSERVMRAQKEWTTFTQDPETRFIDKVCDYEVGGQACLHYSSVLSRRPAMRSIKCVDQKGAGGNIRAVKNDYNIKHNAGWYKGWMQEKGLSCEADEWPPAYLWQARDRNVWIRYSPKKGNAAAGQIWKGACPDKVRTETVGVPTSDHKKIGKHGKVCCSIS